MKFKFVFMILCFDILYIQACSLPKCKPGTQHCIVGSVGADCRGVLGCLKSCPPGSNPIGPLVPSKFSYQFKNTIYIFISFNIKCN